MKSLDKTIFSNSIILLVLPTITFLFGFTKIYISIPLIIMELLLTYRTIKDYKSIAYYPKRKYWIIASITIFIWLFFSGIGDFSFQNHDFHFRHAIFRDLINYNWPINYGSYYLTYYFSYFLPSALIGKITSYRIANIFLFIYSYICIMSILYLINRYLKKDSYWALFLLIFFSGFDALCMLSDIFSFVQLEWWNGLFQYSSNTTSVYWVFNQVIPIWLLLSLIINSKDSKDILFLSALSFFYSPYATICLIPIMIYFFLKYSNHNLKIIFSFSTLFSIIVGIILSLFYTSGNGTYINGLIFLTKISIFSLLINYVIFIIIEIGFYFIITFDKYKKEFIYKIILFELLIIPFYIMSPANDFCMRASVPALFLLMILFINYLEKNNKKKYVIFFFLLISFINPVHEISRSVYYTFTKKNYIADSIFSVGKPRKYEEIVERQFYGKANSLFYKYISK